MRTNHVELLANIRRQRKLKAIPLSAEIGVSLSALTNFLNGIPVTDIAGERLIAWVDRQV